MTANSEDLRREVKAFAADITTTVRAVLGRDEITLHATILDGLVRVATDAAGIGLHCNRVRVMTLRVNFHCDWDSSGKFLAVERSEFHLLAADVNEPLLRFEFDREAREGLPVAHLHVHAHRDATTWAMSRTGDRTRRSRVRARSGVPTMKELHLPLGGKRFRPSLEDVMQFVVEEFGIDAVEGWKKELAEGRARWRLLQARSSARDAPEEVAEVLRSLGYAVESPMSQRPTGPALSQY